MSSGNTSQIPSIFMGPTVSLVTHGLGRRRAVSLLPQRRREGAVGVYGFFLHMVDIDKRVATSLLLYLWDRKGII